MKFYARLTILALGAILLSATAAHAKVGIATGVGSHLSNPLTPHIGRLYYKPTPGAAVQGAIQAPTALEEFLAAPKKVKKRAAKLKCDQLHAQYLGRHGFTTPRPLKGFTGCKKYAMDQAYWHPTASSVENPAIANPVATVTNTVTIQLHNIVLPW